MVYPELTKEAEQKMKQIFKSKRIGGQRVRLKRGHKVKWAPPLNPGWYGIPDGNPKYIVEPATIHVDDWLKVQHAAGEGFGWNNFLAGAYDPTVEQAKRSIETGRNDIPTPVLEIRHDGRIDQEGRSRALGAKEGGAKWIPIWIAIQVYR